MVEANHLARAAGTGHAREEAGGSTFAALLLFIWENLIIHLLGVHDALGRQEQNPLSFRAIVELMGKHEDKVLEM